VSAVLGIIVLLEVQTDDLNGGVVLSAELVVSRAGLACARVPTRNAPCSPNGDGRTPGVPRRLLQHRHLRAMDGR
jgi:hypothetical protein